MVELLGPQTITLYSNYFKRHIFTASCSELLRKKFRQSKQHKYNSVSDFIDSSTRGKHICSLCQFDLKGIRFNLHLLSEHHAESIIKKMKKDEKKLFDKIRTNMEQKRKQILKWRWGKI